MYNGKVIKALLNTQKKRSKDLLVHMGMSEAATISSLISGNPSANRLEKLAEFFNVPIDMFFERDKKSSSELEEPHYLEAKYINELLAMKDNQLTEKDAEIARLQEELQKKSRIIELQQAQIAAMS